MKRTTILRKTPLKRVSKKRAKENPIYLKKRAEFLQEHPYCEVWLKALGLSMEDASRRQFPVMATDIHHKARRTGSNFLDDTTWMAVSRQNHIFLHNNPSWARARGYLV